MDVELRITIATFLRWIRIASDAPELQYVVRPVDIIGWSEFPFMYRAVPNGPLMRDDSTELLAPGDYAIFRYPSEHDFPALPCYG